MKVINSKQLSLMPRGTVYSDYEDGVIDGLYIKGKSFDDDWNVHDLLDPELSGEPYKIIDKLEKGEDVKYTLSQEKMSDLSQQDLQFLVYTKDDVKRIIGALGSCT